MDAQIPHQMKSGKKAETLLHGKLAKWNEAIDQAREILKHRKANQMMVAELALDVCDITRGGHKPEGTFTIRRFAKEIGVNHKTLSQWIGLYRMVYSKLPPDVQNKIKLVNIEDVARSARTGASDHELTIRAREVMQKSDIDIKLCKYLASLRAISVNIMRPDFFRAKPETIEELIYWNNKVRTLLNNKIKGLGIPYVGQNHGLISKYKHKSFSANRAIADQTVSHGVGEFGDVKISDFDREVYKLCKAQCGKFRLVDIYPMTSRTGSKLSKRLATSRSLQKLVEMNLLEINGAFYELPRS